MISCPIKPTQGKELSTLSPGKFSIILASFPIQYMTLSLGLFSLANLLIYAGWSGFSLVASVVFLFTLLSMLLRSFVWPDIFFEEIRKPNEISSYVTGILAAYFFVRELYSFSPRLAVTLWFVAFLCNLTLVGQFVRIQIRRHKNPLYMTPIWYLIFVSICAAALNGHLIGIQILPYLILAFAFISYLVITPILIRRLILGPPFDQVQEPAKALMCATPSLILLSFMNIFPNSPMLFALLLLLISQLFLLWLYSIMITSFRREAFIPGYASFTFALATSCLDLAHFRDRFLTPGEGVYELLSALARIEMGIASMIILYLLFCFIIFGIQHVRALTLIE